MLLKTVRDVPFGLYLNISFINLFKENTWSAETVIKIPSKKVEGWALPEMPGGSKRYICYLSQCCAFFCFALALALGLPTLHVFNF